MTFESDPDVDRTESHRGSSTRTDSSTRPGSTAAERTVGSSSGVSRRRFLNASAAGLAAAGLGASTTASAQSSRELPSYDEAAAELSHPDPSEEAVALYRYLHDVWGEGVLSGQQYEPWGIDEMDHVESVTGQLPAVQGADFIHDDKSQPIDQALDWWDRGGITAIMWHWGVPGLELQDEYEESRNTYIEENDFDVSAVLEEGTDANDAFWEELDEVADQLEVLRDAGVPIVWRPFHEFDGTWFWWGMEGADFFIELWETMHEHFVEERDLDNLLWLLPHSHSFKASWVPDASTYDLGGADDYPGGPGSQSATYDTIVDTHGERPPIFHECGEPLDPDAIERDDAWWTMWIVWHTDWLTDTEDSYLEEVYNHELTVNLEDLPDIVEEYGAGSDHCEATEIDPYVRVDDGEWQHADSMTVEAGSTVELGPQPADGGSWSWSGPGVSASTRVLSVAPNETSTYTATYTNGCGASSTAAFTVTVDDSVSDPCEDAADTEQLAGGQTVCDVDGGGNYRDVNGDGAVSNGDVTDFFSNQHVDPWDSRTDLFDFDGNDDVGQGDVVELFHYVN